MKDDRKLTIGKLANVSGVGVETVRFYERQGLIQRPPKGEGSFRCYPEVEAKKIRFIKKAQELGFTLKEIKELLELQISEQATCGNITQRAEVKLSEVEAKIKDLQSMRRSLIKLVDSCGDKNISIKQCRVLDCFDPGWKC